MLMFFFFFFFFPLRLLIHVHVHHLQICREFFSTWCKLHISSVKNAIVWHVTPCSLVEIHPYFGRTCYTECAQLAGSSETMTFYLATPSHFRESSIFQGHCHIALGHASPSLFLCSVSIKFLSDLWNLYRVIQE